MPKPFIDPATEKMIQIHRAQTRVGKAPYTKTLNTKQQAFVTAYARDGMNATAAARFAGYKQPEVVGTNMKKKPAVAKAIAIERERYAIASDVSRKKVIDWLIEAVDMARTKADPIAMVAGAREIGKICGFYEPRKVEVTHTVSGAALTQKLNAMTDTELLQLTMEKSDVLEGEFERLD